MLAASGKPSADGVEVCDEVLVLCASAIGLGWFANAEVVVVPKEFCLRGACPGLAFRVECPMT